MRIFSTYFWIANLLYVIISGYTGGIRYFYTRRSVSPERILFDANEKPKHAKIVTRMDILEYRTFAVISQHYFLGNPIIVVPE